MQPLASLKSEQKVTEAAFDQWVEPKTHDDESILTSAAATEKDSILNSVTRSIECAVCLERLRISDNRVLPCQHTYHFGCLQLTFAREGELRCPECRRLSDVHLHDLLPNYTLNKILESLPFDEQHNSQSDIKRQYLRTRSLNASSFILHSQQNEARRVEQPMPLCRAMYDYKALHKTDLTFRKGDLIVLLRQLDEHWFLGEAGNVQGTFPVNYVKVINPLWRPLCKALFSFEERHVKEMSISSDTNLCLHFSKNDLIHLTERIDESWAKGKVGSRTGIFPLNFVTVNSAAKDLLNKWCRTNKRMDLLLESSSAETDAWLSTSSGESDKPLSSTMDRHSYAKARKSRAMSLTSQSLVMSSSSQHTQQNFDNSQLDAATTAAPTYESFSSILASHQITSRAVASSSRLSTLGCVTMPVSPPQIQIYIAKHDYCARRGDELDLEAGKWYAVSQICSDGWFKGTDVESGKTGAFPGNFVFPADQLNKPLNLDNKPGKNWSVKQNRHSMSAVERPVTREVAAPSHQELQSPLRLDEKIRKLSLSSSPTGHYNTMETPHSSDSRNWVTLSGYGYQQAQLTSELNSSNGGEGSAVNQSTSESATMKQFVATLAYPPQNDTEVELVAGDVIIVHKQDPDGWLTGTVRRTGKTGLLPASFVKEVPLSGRATNYSTCL